MTSSQTGRTSAKKPHQKSQLQIRREIQTALGNRELVTLWGNAPNGKTHTYWQVWLKSVIGIGGRDIKEIPASHAENYSVEILPNVEVTGRTETITSDKIMRQILESYNVPNAPYMRQYAMRVEFKKLLIRLEAARIIPCIAMDNVELMPLKGFTVLKGLNELRHQGKKIGIAVLLSGDFRKRKMPSNFWQHCSEFNCGKVSQEEMQEFIANLVGPRFAGNFKQAAVKRLLECSSTLEMANYIKRAVRDMSEGVIEEVNADLLSNYYEEDAIQRMRLAA